MSRGFVAALIGLLLPVVASGHAWVSAPIDALASTLIENGVRHVTDGQAGGVFILYYLAVAAFWGAIAYGVLWLIAWWLPAEEQQLS